MHHEDPEPAGVPPSTAAASPRRQRTLKEQRAEINELKAMVTSLESRLADSEKHLHEAREHTVKWMYYHTEVARDLAVIAGHIHPGLTLSSHPASQALLKIQGVLDENPHKAALKLVADTLMEVLIQTWSAEGVPDASIDRRQVRKWLIARKRGASELIEQSMPGATTPKR